MTGSEDEGLTEHVRRSVADCVKGRGILDVSQVATCFVAEHGEVSHDMVVRELIVACIAASVPMEIGAPSRCTSPQGDAGAANGTRLDQAAE
jgi:hypothetical protein